ncbi:MAG: class I SAM-dependent methyltransferase [Bdellovibrionales bacterium]|nr:class I SAM-dependent methyltransferase [Bdellovibrionales bacterium]
MGVESPYVFVSEQAPPHELLRWVREQIPSFYESDRLIDNCPNLVWSEQELKLVVPRNSVGPYVKVDFSSPQMNHRRRQGLGKKQLFAKALGLSAQPKTALDLTAGFATDAFTMLLYGLHVTALERHPIVYKLLEDGVRRAHLDLDIGLLIKNQLQIEQCEALEYLHKAEPLSYDLIFYDPMYPTKKKTALSKKNMQVLQAFIIPNETEEMEEVLNQALKMARQRVVVKRPPSAEPLLRKPSLSFPGKSVRYDIYLSGK